MKRIITLLLTMSCLLIVLGACENTVEGPFTNDNSRDFANNIPTKIDDDILQTCYDFTEYLGYEIKVREKYKSVLLGESNVSTVSVYDDAKRDMVDKDDYLVIFDEIRIVIDSDTGVALGTIPYV